VTRVSSRIVQAKKAPDPRFFCLPDATSAHLLRWLLRDPLEAVALLARINAVGLTFSARKCAEIERHRSLAGTRMAAA
jgi:hypothetical protein